MANYLNQNARRLTKGVTTNKEFKIKLNLLQ